MRRRGEPDLSTPHPTRATPATGRAAADDPLLAAVLAGERDAPARIFAAYAPVVRAVIGRYLARRLPGATDLVDDLTHEVFIALLADDARRLRGFEGRCGCSFAGWLRVVAVRMTIDALRRERRLVALDDDSAAMTELRRTLRSDAPDPADAAVAAELAHRLAATVGGLAPKDRLLVELHLVRGVPLPEVARALGVSANAAYVRKSRVLKTLRHTIEASR